MSRMSLSFYFLVLSMCFTESFCDVGENFKSVPKLRTWLEANKYCQKEKQNLVVFKHSDEYENKLGDLLEDGQTYWMGIPYSNFTKEKVCYKRPDELLKKMEVESTEECSKLCNTTLLFGINNRRARCFCLGDDITKLNNVSCEIRRHLVVYRRGNDHYCPQITKVNESIHENHVQCNTTSYFICETGRSEDMPPSQPPTTAKANTNRRKNNPEKWLAIGVTLGIVFAVLLFISICVSYAIVKRRLIRKERRKTGYTPSMRKMNYENESDSDHVYDVVEDVATSCSIEGSSNIKKLERIRLANLNLEKGNHVGNQRPLLESLGEKENDDYLKPSLPPARLPENGPSQSTSNNNKDKTKKAECHEDNYDHMTNELLQERKGNADDPERDYFILCSTENDIIVPNNESLLEKTNAIKDEKSQNVEQKSVEESVKMGEYVHLGNGQGNTSNNNTEQTTAAGCRMEKYDHTNDEILQERKRNSKWESSVREKNSENTLDNREADYFILCPNEKESIVSNNESTLSKTNTSEEYFQNIERKSVEDSVKFEKDEYVHLLSDQGNIA